MPGISEDAHAMRGSADKASLESIARNYLQGNAATFGVQNQIPEIQLSNVEEAPDFYVTRFSQTYNGLRVYNTTASVMISKDGLRAVDAVTRFKSLTRVIDSKIDAQTALNNAIAAIAPTVTPRGTPKTQQVLYVVQTPTIRHSNGGSLPTSETSTEPQVARVSWLVSVPTLKPLGDWSILVDGPTGKIISKQNLILYDTGQGDVFHYSNPIQTGGNLAWPAPDDNDHTILTEQETRVQLLHLNPGTGKLMGSFVDLNATGIVGGYKSAGQADNASRLYYYTRADDRFEEVMVYYYVDWMHSYLQQIGEVWLLNYPVPAHAHYGAFVNAFYSSSDLGLHFGDGDDAYPFDLAEDADVIIHEYGHAIHGDQGLFNGWVSEEMGAFSEGFSDYLSASFLDQGAAGTEGCLAEWFGYELGYPTGSYPYCMRDTFSTKHYPEDMTYEVHNDGEMWSAALWRLRGLLGRGVTDRLAIETGYYVWPWASFRDAVNAMVQVDRTAYAGVHETTIRQVFRDNGMLTYSIRSQAYPWGPWQQWPINIPAQDRGFENGWGTSWGTGWTDSSVTPQIVSSPVYAGNYAAKLLGSTGGSATESFIYYEFTMPSDATWLRLSFRYRIDTIDWYPWDWFEWRLGTPTDYVYSQWIFDTGGQFNYERLSINVGDLRGQTCRLTFLLHDDGDSGFPTYGVYIDGNGMDDISLRWSNLHAPITINGETQDTPKPSWPTFFEKRFFDGTAVSISAPSELRVGGLTYRFMQWSDGQLNPVHPSFTPSWDWYLEAQYYASSWSGWEKVPGATSSAPTVIYDWWDGAEHMFVRGMDNHLWHKLWWSGVGGGWSGWEDMKGSTKDQPAAVVDSIGNLHVVVAGMDGKFWYRMQSPGGAWGSWAQIRSSFTGTSPCLVRTLPGVIDLIVRVDGSGALRHNYWLSGAGWQYDSASSSWDTSMDGSTPNRPALAYDSSIGTLYVFVRGNDNGIYHNDLKVIAGTWSGWVKLTPGSTLSTPAVVADGGRVDLMVRGGSNTIWHGYRTNAEAPNVVHWEQVPGATLDTPVEAYRSTDAGTMLEVMVRGMDSALYHNTYDIQMGRWASWTKIPGSTPSTPALLVNPDWNDEMYVCVRGNDSGIYFASIIVWVGPVP